MKNEPYQDAVSTFGKHSDEAVLLSRDEGQIKGRLKYCQRRLAFFNAEIERCAFLTYKGVATYIESCEKLRNKFIWLSESLEDALEELQEDDWLAV